MPASNLASPNTKTSNNASIKTDESKEVDDEKQSSMLESSPEEEEESIPPPSEQNTTSSSTVIDLKGANKDAFTDPLVIHSSQGNNDKLVEKQDPLLGNLDLDTEIFIADSNQPIKTNGEPAPKVEPETKNATKVNYT